MSETVRDHQKSQMQGFPGGSVVRSTPANVRATGSSPQSGKIPHVAKQLSPWPPLQSPAVQWTHCRSEKPTLHNQRRKPRSSRGPGQPKVNQQARNPRRLEGSKLQNHLWIKEVSRETGKHFWTKWKWKTLNTKITCGLQLKQCLEGKFMALVFILKKKKDDFSDLSFLLSKLGN